MSRFTSFSFGLNGTANRKPGRHVLSLKLGETGRIFFVYLGTDAAPRQKFRNPFNMRFLKKGMDGRKNEKSRGKAPLLFGKKEMRRTLFSFPKREFTLPPSRALCPSRRAACISRSALSRPWRPSRRECRRHPGTPSSRKRTAPRSSGIP